MLTKDLLFQNNSRIKWYLLFLKLCRHIRRKPNCSGLNFVVFMDDKQKTGLHVGSGPLSRHCWRSLQLHEIEHHKIYYHHTRKFLYVYGMVVIPVIS